MAASDKPFRDQNRVDIVYAVSCILMLLSIMWMFVQDYYREYRDEQYIFRKVEVAMAQRQALKLVPDSEESKKLEDEVDAQRKTREGKLTELAAARAELLRLQPKKENAEGEYNAIKADVESFTSLRNIALEHQDNKTADQFDAKLLNLNKTLAASKAEKDKIAFAMKVEQVKIQEIDGNFNEAILKLKKLNDQFDTQVKLAITKRWGFGDWFRTLPIINGFADPLRIQQYAIDDVTIDYNFKKVPRFDRCTSCHLGIDKPLYTRPNLEALTKEAGGDLAKAKELYDRRMKVLEGQKDAALVPNPHKLDLLSLSDKVLTPARVTEFCAHPKLDLYVGATSKHPVEKFGCTSCHAGQGSGTSFINASHSPNLATTREDWTKARGWQPDHMWDFPMLPMRFVESSCLKCHHEVTDLISRDNRVEAPKLLRGHTLIKENGCFGCHEINGTKNGVRIGPDLRLEPTPSLDSMIPLEKELVENDPNGRPGNLRKVGPALTRLSEKTNAGFVEKWLRSPSSFRPDTKMPHYYGLSTNDVAYLKQSAPEHEKEFVEKFPNTEIVSIAHFLMSNSKTYLADAKARQADTEAVKKADQDALVDFLVKGRLTDEEKKAFETLKRKIKLQGEKTLVDQAPGYVGAPKKGRVLFTEKGCLSCHTHQGTQDDQGTIGDGALFSPSLTSEAAFGPNLSQLKGKFADMKAARVWLIQWILDPHVHSPRSRMPVTHLSPTDAADIAAWLLDQEDHERDYAGMKWSDIKMDPVELQDLQKLAEVYLTRMLSKSDMERFFKGLTEEQLAKLDKNELNDDTVTLMLRDVTAEERTLFRHVTDPDALKNYLGKKAVNRLGCYACHDIPGFENAKPIGVALNDWGKKPADRLAFEDIKNFYAKHYYTVDVPTGKEGVKDGKQPYEKFYTDLLLGHQATREGYLNQKIRNPRSYDFNRVFAWDDRSRMPQFTLSRPRKSAGEDAATFEGRTFKDEAEAREAVATFVLGLVAEQLPAKSIHQPTGDRLAEVKGRQVLDKFNCNGCHLIRPGVYDFKRGSKTMEELEAAFNAQSKVMGDLGEFIFKNHTNWEGRNSLSGDRLTAFGLKPTFDGDEKAMVLRLTEALRFVGNDKTIKNIPASALVLVKLEDLLSNPSAVQSQAELERQFSTVHAYGGAFGELLVPWLEKRDPKLYPPTGVNAAARASLPPSLIGQGERTQPDWLFQFLLNPHEVRRKSVLRMPRFNMSKDEARTLVAYFAAVTRLNNTGIGLQYPLDETRERGDLDSTYWLDKTRDYVETLKRTAVLDKDKKEVKGKDGKSRTQFDERLEAYAVLWEQIRKDNAAAIEQAETSIKTKTDDRSAVEKSLKAEKDADKKKELQFKLDVLDFDLKQLRADRQRFEIEGAGGQKDNWLKKEAYAADGYRLLASKELCTKCHQVGSITAAELQNQGPPLHLAALRLRPDWIVRWVNKPERFVPYQSLMPPYFSSKEAKYQQFHAGVSMEQIHALRDVLANFPRVSSLEVNRRYIPPAPPAAK